MGILKAKAEEERSPSTQFCWADAVVLAAFGLFAFGTYLGRWKGITPFVFLGSDAGIVSSFVAGYEHPDLFRTDALLGDFTNFRYYLAVHPVLIGAASRIVGDYGTAYISLLILTVFVQCSGFYVLGRVLFRSRYWAFLLSVITLCPIALPVRELWGVYDDPLPRSLFHACLPYVLAAAFYFKSNYKMWPLLMMAIGATFYTHPVSAPHWAFAIWLGMWAFLPDTWSLPKRTAYMFLLGLIFVATALPWALNYSMVRDRAVSEGVQYKDVVGIISARVGAELLDVGLALRMWSVDVSSWPLSVFCLWAVSATAAVALVRREMRQDLSLVAIWAVGILFVAVGLTSIEETVCRVCDLKRFQMDSVRGIKYLVPLMLLLCIWPLAEICKELTSRSLTRMVVMLAGALVVSVWAYENPPVMFLDAVKAWAHGRFVPSVSRTETGAMEALEVVRKNVPPGSRVLPLALPLEIRYCALRPVAYAYKDGGIFADTNLNALPDWERTRREVEAASTVEDARAKLERIRSLSERLGAEYILTDFQVDSRTALKVGLKLIWSNDSFALLRSESSNNPAAPRTAKDES